MTTASAHHVRRPGTILSRLLLVLALVLFGLPQVYAHGMGADGGPAARSQVEQAMGIASAQRHLARAQVPDDTSPDGVVPGTAHEARPIGTAAAPSPAPRQFYLPIAFRILPPLRGPPAV